MKNVQDRFFHQAKREGYAARSVYKLQEIDERYRLFQPETTILDVGSAPGSWLQFIHRRLKGQVRLYGIDLQPVTLTDLPDVHVVVGNVSDLLTAWHDRFPPSFHGIVSDAAPATTGNRFSDHIRSMELCRSVLDLACRRLCGGGYLVMKIFQGEDLALLQKDAKRYFTVVKNMKPLSSRQESVELFMVCRGFRGETQTAD